MSLIKRQLIGDQARGVIESRDGARELLATAEQAPDYREGVLSFIERRPPGFDGSGEQQRCPAQHESSRSPEIGRAHV